MNSVSGIPGILLFKNPNKHTTQSSTSPSIFVISFNTSIGNISSDEIYAVGTRCGTSIYDQARVEEYKAYKLGQKTMEEIIKPKKYEDWRTSCNNQMRKWFGDDLIDMY
jgi:hypothetical protein